MCDDRCVYEENYIKYSYLINRRYVKKHYYRFAFYNLNKDKNKHSAWSKIDLSIDLINDTDYDLYVYLDSDCIFNKQDISLYQYLSNAKYCKTHSNPDILFLKDSIGLCFPCSGFFIFNRKALEIFIDWKSNFSDDEKIFFRKHPWEQKILQNRYNKYALSIIDDNHFGMNTNNFIIHLAARSTKYRLEKFKEYYLNTCKEELTPFDEVFNTNENSQDYFSSW